MNKVKHLFFAFLISSYCFGQSPLKFERPHVIFPGCETAEDASKCYESKVLNFIDTTLTKTISEKVIRLAKKDTISFYSAIYFDEVGLIIKRQSSFSASVDSLYKDLDYLINKFPKVEPVLDEYSNGVAQLVSTVHGFSIDRKNAKLIPIEGYEPEEIPLIVIEQVPVHPDCSENLSNKASKDCMNKAFRKHISKNFNGDLLANALGLSPGIKRIFVFFKINKEGEITDVTARAPNPTLEREGIRIVKLMPKMKRPGIQRGKPVIVPYVLPIAFRIEGDGTEQLTKKQLRQLKRQQRKRGK